MEYEAETYSDIVFPDNFKKKIKEKLKDKTKLMIESFDDDFVLAQHIVSKKKAVIEEFELSQRNLITSFFDKKIIHIDDDELREEINKMFYYHDNGIAHPLDYNLLLMYCHFNNCMRGKERKITMRSCELKFKEDINYTIIITSTKPELTENDYYFNEIITKAIYKKDQFFKNNKKNKTKNNRKVITRSIRYEVFKKHNFKCKYCGISKEETPLEIDHIIPLSKGGTDEIDNLQPLCKPCNLSKSDRIYKKMESENGRLS